MLVKILLLFSILFTAINIQSCKSETEYINSIEKWHAKRDSSIRNVSGWLSLAGLFWLKQGDNTFGSDPKNMIIFPEQAPAFIGSFSLNDSIVSVKINQGVEVLNDSTLVSEMILVNDNQPNTSVLSSGALFFYVIKRQDKYGIRLKDLEHPNLKSFSGIEHFPINPAWKIQATLIQFETPKTIPIPNVLGQVSNEPSPGLLKFEINDTTYQLEPIGERDSKQYWLIFGDATNGDETYGAGRFLYVEKADENGNTYIDFNKAYNPPCVFSPFATCPLPPKQNILDVSICAGEKNYEIHYY